MSTTKMMMAALGAVVALEGLAAIGRIQKKVIVDSWETFFAPIETVLENADKFSELPIDGITVKLFDVPLAAGGKITGSSLFMDPMWTKADLAPKTEVLRQIVAKPHLGHSLLAVNFQPRKHTSITNDAAWALMANNMRVAAWTAKQGGLKGIRIDNEDYWHQVPFFLLPEDGADYETAAKLARQRGREVFSGVFQEFPDIELMFFWIFSLEPEYASAQDPASMAAQRGDLWLPFVNGILDVCPLTAKLIDGDEHAYHHQGSLFAASARRIRHDFLALVEPENRQKYSAVISTSFGLYLDMYINPVLNAKGNPNWWAFGPKNGSRVNHFAQNLELALDSADDLVWLYGEKRSVIPWGPVKPYREGYAPAYTNGTWEASLPGFNEVVRRARDPFGTLLPKLPELEQTGSNCVTVAAEDDSKSETHRMTARALNVKPGSWYAVVAELKGASAYCEIYQAQNDKINWNVAVHRAAFSPRDAEGWMKATALVHVPENINELKISYGSRRDQVKAPVECRKLAVYEVK